MNLSQGKPWMDAQLLASLEVVDHHLVSWQSTSLCDVEEVIEDRDAKLQRLKALIQVYHLIQERLLNFYISYRRIYNVERRSRWLLWRMP